MKELELKPQRSTLHRGQKTVMIRNYREQWKEGSGAEYCTHQAASVPYRDSGSRETNRQIPEMQSRKSE